MASSESEFEADLEEQAKSLTTCSICLDRFSCPKVLPCQHTFCLACIKRCLECLNTQRVVQLSNFPCPTCRKICYVPQGGLDHLATDFRIGQILDLMSAIENSIQSQQKSKSCSVPGFGRCSICRFQKRETMATSFCLQCEKAFCNQCLSHHAKTRIFHDHVIINDSQSNDESRQNSDKCVEHEAKFKYFCEDCSILLCTVCLFSEHGDHSVKEKERAENGLYDQLSKYAEDLRGQVCKVTDLKIKINNFKQFITNSKEVFEAEVCSAYEEALKSLELLKIQLLSDASQSFASSLKELENVDKLVDSQNSLLQEKYDSIMTIQTEKGSGKFFVDFKLIRDSLQSLPQAAPKTLNFEMPKFLATLGLSIGSIDNTSKSFDLNTCDVESLIGEFNKETLKECQNENKEYQNKPKKAIPVILSAKPLKATRLHVNIQNGFNDKTSSSSNNNKKGLLKPGSSDKIIQGLGRRLSGRLSLANFQINPLGATALSVKKMNWIAEGFSQCRDCCFFKRSQQWMVAACDYRATNAGDRIKIFDLTGRQQGVINVRAIVEPWALIYQKSSNSFMVTDHSSRSIKMINLDEDGRCSKITTMHQYYSEKPTGICMTNSGSFIVTDVGVRQHRLAIYLPNSNFLERKVMFGKKGNVDGEILLSNYVCIDGNDRAVVSDIEANNIKVFDLEGHQLLKFSCSCSFDGGKEMEPQGVATDDLNNILVADQATNGVVMFNSEGQLVGNVACCRGKPWGISYADELRMLAVATDKGLEVFEL